MITLTNAIITIQNHQLPEELKIFLLFFVDITNKIKNYDKKTTIKEIRENSKNLLLHKTNKVILDIDDSLYEFLKKNKKTLEDLEDQNLLEKLLKILSKDKTISEKLINKKNKTIIGNIAKLIKQQIQTITPEQKPIPLIDINLDAIHNIVNNTVKGINRFNNITKIEAFVNSLANKTQDQKSKQKSQKTGQTDIENLTIAEKKQFIKQTIPTLIADQKISNDLINKLTDQLQNIENFTKIRPLNREDAKKEQKINTIITSLANKKPINKATIKNQIKSQTDINSRSKRYVFALSILVDFLNQIEKKISTEKGMTSKTKAISQNKTKQFNIKKINKIKTNQKKETIKTIEAIKHQLDDKTQQNKQPTNKKLKIAITLAMSITAFAITLGSLVVLSNLTTIMSITIATTAPIVTTAIGMIALKQKKVNLQENKQQPKKHETHQILQSFSEPLITKKEIYQNK